MNAVHRCGLVDYLLIYKSRCLVFGIKLIHLCESEVWVLSCQSNSSQDN